MELKYYLIPESALNVIITGNSKLVFNYLNPKNIQKFQSLKITNVNLILNISHIEKNILETLLDMKKINFKIFITLYSFKTDFEFFELLEELNPLIRVPFTLSRERYIVNSLNCNEKYTQIEYIRKCFELSYLISDFDLKLELFSLISRTNYDLNFRPYIHRINPHFWNVILKTRSAQDTGIKDSINQNLSDLFIKKHKNILLKNKTWPVITNTMIYDKTLKILRV